MPIAYPKLNSFEFYKLILQLSFQEPSSHHGDARRLDSLRGLVVGFGCSHEPLPRITTHNSSFQQIYAELEVSLQ